MHFLTKKLPQTFPKRRPNPSKIDSKNDLFFYIDFFASGARFWKLLGLHLSLLSVSWASLGRSWPLLGRLLNALGRLLAGLGRLLGASWLSGTFPTSILEPPWLILTAPGLLFWRIYHQFWANDFIPFHAYVHTYVHVHLLTHLRTYIHTYKHRVSKPPASSQPRRDARSVNNPPHPAKDGRRMGFF